MRYYLDEFKYDGSRIYVKGWAGPEHLDDTLVVRLLDEDGQQVPVSVQLMARPDVVRIMYKQEGNKNLGFAFYYEGPLLSRAVLELSAKETEIDCIHVPLRMKEAEQEYRRQRSLPHRIKRFLKTKNKAEFRLNEKYLFLNDQDKKYAVFYERTLPDKNTLKEHAERTFEKEPLFSVLVPVFRPDMKFLEEMIASLKAQTYSRFELVLADASPEDGALKACLENAAKKDSRIRPLFLQENGGISENTNAALEAAKGDYIALLDQDDLLHPDALYQMAEALNREPAADFLYSDEDKLNMDTGLHFDPYFKPDFSPALLLSGNYICHLLVLKKELAVKAGGFRKAYDGAQDHDLVLRASELAEKIVHVPKILYTWRVHSGSTAKGIGEKNYAEEAGKHAVEDALRRRGFEAEARPIPTLPAHFEPVILLREEPLISVLIPNKDKKEMLERCIRSLKETNSYNNIEILVIENNSEEAETFSYYEELEKDPQIRVLRYQGSFNYAAINNCGAQEARGDVLLLLNNDTEVIAPDSLKSMLSYLQMEKTGIVGAKLLYGDGALQHAGVLALTEGAAHHLYLGSAPSEQGYMGRLEQSANVSAVTGACLMIRKELYLSLGGMDERFRVAYNDIDLCLNVLDRGQYVVFDAFAKLYHYESQSRGYEDTKEKRERQEEEARLLYEKHPERVGKDPYYHPALGVANGWYALP